MSQEFVTGPDVLVPGDRITIVLAKTGRLRFPSRDPQTVEFEVDRRDGDAWLMKNGSRVEDAAPCYREGRMSVSSRERDRRFYESTYTVEDGVVRSVTTGDVPSQRKLAVMADSGFRFDMEKSLAARRAELEILDREFISRLHLSDRLSLTETTSARRVCFGDDEPKALMYENWVIVENGQNVADVASISLLFCPRRLWFLRDPEKRTPLTDLLIRARNEKVQKEPRP